jgi:hypothetical protein
VSKVDREDHVGLGGEELCGEELAAGSGRPVRDGSMPAALRIFHTVEAGAWWPRPTSSPWMRR